MLPSFQGIEPVCLFLQPKASVDASHSLSKIACLSKLSDYWNSRYLAPNEDLLIGNVRIAAFTSSSGFTSLQCNYVFTMPRMDSINTPTLPALLYLVNSYSCFLNLLALHVDNQGYKHHGSILSSCQIHKPR